MSSSASFASPRLLKIGIVGFGPFAQFLAKTLIRQGHSMRATSRSDYSDQCAHLGITFFRCSLVFIIQFFLAVPLTMLTMLQYSRKYIWMHPYFEIMEEFLQSDNEVILLCTSILSLSEVIKSMKFQCLKQPTLFVDVLSVKEHPRDVLMQALPPESDLLCTHPMFGPESGKDGWEGLTFMYEKSRIKDDVVCSSFLQIFAREGCRMLEMTCEEHDEVAARSQFLTHMIGRVLGEMQIERTPIDTKGFQKLIEVKESTANDSFDLFKGLFVHNRFARQQLKNFEIALESVKQKLLVRIDEQKSPR